MMRNAYACPSCGRKTYRVEYGGQVIYEHADTGSVLCKKEGKA